MKRMAMFLRQLLLAPFALLLGIPEGSAAANSGAGEPPAGQPSSSSQNGTAAPPAAPDAAAIASEILGALDKRTQRFEGSITKSVAEKYGMTEDDVQQILAAEKDKRDKLDRQDERHREATAAIW